VSVRARNLTIPASAEARRIRFPGSTSFKHLDSRPGVRGNVRETGRFLGARHGHASCSFD
jgi:hypothetical protein